MHTIILQDFRESGDKVQDDGTTAQHLVTCTIMIDTTVKNKTTY